MRNTCAGRAYGDNNTLYYVGFHKMQLGVYVRAAYTIHTEGSLRGKNVENHYSTRKLQTKMCSNTRLNGPITPRSVIIGLVQRCTIYLRGIREKINTI